jgi:hypothetical protein
MFRRIPLPPPESDLVTDWALHVQSVLLQFLGDKTPTVSAIRSLSADALFNTLAVLKMKLREIEATDDSLVVNTSDGVRTAWQLAALGLSRFTP